MEKDELILIGFQRNYLVTDDTHTLIPQLWDEYLERQNEIKHWIKEVSAGICFDGNEQGFSYFVGGFVTDIEDIPNGMEVLKLPPQKYAIFTFKGGADKIGDHWEYINDVWDKQTDCVCTGVDFEYYDSRFHPDSDESELDIYISIK